METIAYNFHDENDTVFKNFKLTAGNYKFFIFNNRYYFEFGSAISNDMMVKRLK